MTMSQTNASTTDWTPQFARWRHGGWYVSNVRHIGGAVSCVSNNYPDKQWRIVCDGRRTGELGEPGDYTYRSRAAAAIAARDLAALEVASELNNWDRIAPNWWYQIVDDLFEVHLLPDRDLGHGMTVLANGAMVVLPRYSLCFEQVLGWARDEVTRRLEERKAGSPSGAREGVASPNFNAFLRAVQCAETPLVGSASEPESQTAGSASLDRCP
jgi:hypothetical protein